MGAPSALGTLGNQLGILAVTQRLGRGDRAGVHQLREGLIERIAVKRAGEPVTYRAAS